MTPEIEGVNAAGTSYHADVVHELEFECDHVNTAGEADMVLELGLECDRISHLLGPFDS